jgi:hypothetical protein
MFRVQQPSGLQAHRRRRHHMQRPAKPDLLRPLLQPLRRRIRLALPANALAPFRALKQLILQRQELVTNFSKFGKGWR